MRTNLPIVDSEVKLQDAEQLVSVTDLHGNIIYANQAFIRISGFTEAELMG